MAKFLTYIDLKLQVLSTFFFFLLWYIFFILAFALSFYIMLHRDFETSPGRYSVPCTLYLVPCTVYPLLCTLYPVPCTLYPVPCTLFRVWICILRLSLALSGENLDNVYWRTWILRRANHLVKSIQSI